MALLIFRDCLFYGLEHALRLFDGFFFDKSCREGRFFFSFFAVHFPIGHLGLLIADWFEKIGDLNGVLIAQKLCFVQFGLFPAGDFHFHVAIL